MKGKISINKIMVNQDEYYLDDKSEDKVEKFIMKILNPKLSLSYYNGKKYVKLS